MPTYQYLCEEDGLFERWVSIHAPSSQAPCPVCDVLCVKSYAAPLISLTATPNKGDEARSSIAMESRWEKDMPAYYRLRKQGLQPRGIDGCAELEARAATRTEIEMGRIIPSKDAIEVGNEISSEMLGRDVTETGRAVGEVVKGKKSFVEVKD